MSVDIDDVPNAARRALAFRAKLADLGIHEDHIFIAVGVQITPMPAAPNTHSLSVIVSRTGHPGESVDFVMACGPIDIVWWQANSTTVLAAAWNALPLAARVREIHRWLTPEDEIRMRKRLHDAELITMDTISPQDADLN